MVTVYRNFDINSEQRKLYDMNSGKYLVRHKNGLFSLFISKDPNGYFVGTAIWYEKHGAWDEEGLRTYWHHKHFLDDSSEKLLDSAKTWIRENLGEPIGYEQVH